MSRSSAPFEAGPFASSSGASAGRSLRGCVRIERKVGYPLNQSGFARYLYRMDDTMAAQDAETVRAAAMGDEAAFTQLVARHHRDLLRVAYVICRDSSLAEDSAQAAWAIAWRRLGDVKDPDQVRSWLVAVAANEARRIMRSRRRSVREISVGDIELSVVPDLRSDPLADGIARADLRRLLDSLDPIDRTLIALRYVGELSSDEIGRVLDVVVRRSWSSFARLASSSWRSSR